MKELDQGKLCDLRLQYDHLPSEFYIDQLDPRKRQRCFVCFVDKIPALILWLCTDQSSGFVRVEAKEIEMNHIYCRLQFRGRKILQNTIRVIATQMQLEGFSEIVTVVHSDNIACIKSIERCGFKKTGALKRLGFFVW